VYFVDEKYVAGVEVGQKSRQVARFIEHRSGSDFQLCMHFIGDDVRQRGFTQSRRTVQQHVVERIASHQSRLDENPEVIHDLLLPGEVVQFAGADLIFELQVAFDVPDVFFGAHSPFCFGQR